METIVHMVDCDKLPTIRRGFCIKKKDQPSGRVRGKLEIDRDLHRVEFFFPNYEHKRLSGYDILKKVAGWKLLNACVLDYMVANPTLMPHFWEQYRGSRYFFLGTVYRPVVGSHLYGRYLFWNEKSEKWDSDYRCLTEPWIDSLGSTDLVAAVPKRSNDFGLFGLGFYRTGDMSSSRE